MATDTSTNRCPKCHARLADRQPIDRVALRHEIAMRELHDGARGELEVVLLLIDAAPLLPDTVEGYAP